MRVTAKGIDKAITFIEEVMAWTVKPTDLDYVGGIKFNEQYKTRTILKHEGTFGQSIGFEPTPMYESWDLYFSLKFDKEGLDITDYQQELEDQHGVIWQLNEDENRNMEELVKDKIYSL